MLRKPLGLKHGPLLSNCKENLNTFLILVYSILYDLTFDAFKIPYMGYPASLYLQQNGLPTFDSFPKRFKFSDFRTFDDWFIKTCSAFELQTQEAL